MGTLADEFLEKHAAALDKLGIVVVSHLHVLNIDSESNFLGDGRNVASGPAQD